MYKKTIIALTLTTLVFAFATIGLGIAWGVDANKKTIKAEEYKTSIENNYKKGYYDFGYELAQTSDALNKLLVSTSKPMQSKLLSEISEHSSKAMATLNSVTLANQDGGAIGFLNKISDYVSALNYRLAKGGELDEEDFDNLTAVYVAINAFENKLKERSDEMSDDYSFMENIGKDSDIFASVLVGLNADIEYPSLIYDGAFSDSLEEVEPKGVEGNELSIEQAREYALSYLNDDAKEIEYVTTDNGKIPAYIYQTSDGKYYISVTVKGGLLVSLTSDAEVKENLHGEDEATEAGKSYLDKIGLDDLVPVWISNYDDIYYINFVYKQDDVLYYPDMIKIKVSSENLDIVGVECLNYLYNHTQRVTQEATVTTAEALKNAKFINVESVRLAVIPTDGGKENLCYEICGSRGDDFYYVYANAKTGEEVNIMRVIDSKDGKLIN